MSIPVIDLDEFKSPDAGKRNGFVGQLGRAFEEVGFVSLKNHGIAESRISALYKVVQQFFSLPLAIKLKYEIPGLAGQRGYTRFGREHAKGSEAPDLKEFFQFGQITEDPGTAGEVYPQNVTVTELPQFTSELTAAYRSFENCGTLLLQAVAQYLSLDQHYFDPYIRNGNSILRCIHYPPIIREPKNALRSEQHEDINLITLLVGASAEGLQVLTKSGDWLALTTQPGQIVVNVGDMLQRLTNNRLSSTTHRVVNPPKELWQTSRFSIPFFLHPVSAMKLDCLENCMDTLHPKSYPDLTAGEYLGERLKEIGLKK